MPVKQFGLCVLLVGLNCSSAWAQTTTALFVTDGSGSVRQTSLIDASAGELLRFPPGEQYNDIAATSADPGAIYSVSLGPLDGARLFTRLDVETGESSVIPLVDNTLGGFATLLAWFGVAFDPNNPDIGYLGLSASLTTGGQLNHIAQFSLSQRSIFSSTLTSHKWSSLAVNAAGELIGSVDFFDDSGERGRVYTIDPASGATSLRFHSGFGDLTGLAFHPEDDRLWAIDALSNDELKQLDPDTGEVLYNAGELFNIGPNGLAFTTVPELPGDFDFDGDVDNADFLDWQRENLGSGYLDNWQENFGSNVSSLLADFNFDGFVDGLDLAILLGNWGQSTSPELGELDGTSPVNGLDLGILLGAWNPPPLAATSAVPEPAAWMLVMIGILCAPRKW